MYLTASLLDFHVLVRERRSASDNAAKSQMEGGVQTMSQKAADKAGKVLTDMLEVLPHTPRDDARLENELASAIAPMQSETDFEQCVALLQRLNKPSGRSKFKKICKSRLSRQEVKRRRAALVDAGAQERQKSEMAWQEHVRASCRHLLDKLSPHPWQHSSIKSACKKHDKVLADLLEGQAVKEMRQNYDYQGLGGPHDVIGGAVLVGSFLSLCFFLWCCTRCLDRRPGSSRAGTVMCAPGTESESRFDNCYAAVPTENGAEVKNADA